MKPLFFLSILFVLSSCSHSNTQYLANYECENGMKIAAQYYPDKAELSIDGLQRELYQTISASGAKYETENGLQPETGLIWWTKGDEATMFETALDHTATADDYAKITVCAEK
jgi:membrane-bound inhibitor of C-type lysozyme